MPFAFFPACLLCAPSWAHEAPRPAWGVYAPFTDAPAWGVPLIAFAQGRGHELGLVFFVLFLLFCVPVDFLSLNQMDSLLIREKLGSWYERLGSGL